MIIVVLLSTIWTFNDFAIVYILTKGGPGGATMVLPVLTYEMAFGAQRLGEAIAVALYMLPPLAIVIIVLARYMRRGQRAMSKARAGVARLQQARRSPTGCWAFLLAARAVPVLLDDDHVVQDRGPDAEPGLHVLALARSCSTTTCSSSRKTDFIAWFGNSVVVAVSSTLLATAIGTIGAYALARLKFLGRAFMSSAVLITYLVPPSILFIPLYAQIRTLGPADSLAGLIAAYPVLHGAVRDLAAHGLLRVDPRGAGGSGDDRRRHPLRRLPPGDPAPGRARASSPPRSTRSPRPGTSSSTRWSSSPT